MIHATQDVFFVFSSDWSQLFYISPTYEQLWQRSCASLYQDPHSWLAAVHPEDRERVVRALQQSPGIAQNQQYRIVQSDGTIRWVAARSCPLPNLAGESECIAVFAEDITDRSRKALYEDEAIFRSLFEAASEAVIVSNSRGEITLFNRRAEELFGYPPEEILGCPVECLMTERCRQGHWHVHKGSDTQSEPQPMGQVCPLYALRKDGTEFPIEAGLSSVQIGDEWFVLTVLTDRTDRQQAEARLRESEDHLRHLIELNPQVPWTADSDGRITDFNERWLQLTGLTREQAMGEGWAQVPHPDDLPAMSAAWTHSITTGDPYDIAHRIKLADGSYRWMRSRAFPRFDQTGRIVGWYGTTEDIHDAKQAEEQLRESEKQFREMADNAPMMVWVADATGNCTYLSQSWYDFTGQTEVTGLGFGWIEAVHPEDRNLAEAAFLDANEHQKSFRVEYRLWHRDGEYRWAIDTASPWFDAEGQFKGYIGSVIDMTDHKRIEQALQESEARLKLAYQATRSGLWDWDIQNNSAHISEEYCLLFGLNPAQRTVSYEEWLNQLHPDDRAAAAATVNQVIHQRQDYYEDEYRVLHPDGIRWLAARGQVFYDAAGNPVRMLGNMQDITERKQAEIALSQLNEGLEQRIADRTAELSRLNDRLQQELLERERSQQILQEQAQLLDLAHDTIMTRDLNGVITFWNRGAENMYGWSQSEAIGRVSHDLLHTQFPIPLTSLTARLLEHGYWEGELVHTCRNGAAITVASRLALQRDRDGKPVKVLEINNDITERKRAEDTRQRLAAIVESSDDGIVSTTVDGIIVSWNPGAERIYGYSAQEIIGQSVQCLLPPDRLHEETHIREQIIQGKRVEHYETLRLHQRGQPINVSLTVSPIRNGAGEVIGISTISREITARIQAEEQLRISSERTRLANAELARAARLKDEFLAGMSHELRTPLNAILGLSEALLEDIFGVLNPDQREHITTIEQSGRHLLELINDILDLSKVESGKMELVIRPTSVQQLCESSLSFVKQQAHHKRIRLDCQIDPELTDLEGDERHIRQVLVNLLSNAVKFTPHGGRVQLQAKIGALRDTVELSVTDTGIGIAPENIRKLFQPFVQLDSALSRRYAGTGLGLALVRRIVELHGGSVGLESQEGKGSCFTVILPWAADQHSQSPAEPEAGMWQDFTLQQALVIEDSEAAADQVARYLTELGAKTLVHPRGGEAVPIALRSQPDVIILDILLPDQSGWEVLVELKANPTTQTIPVIVISVMDERSRSLEMGAAAHLLKPFTRQQLQQTLSRVLAAVEPRQPQTIAVASTQPAPLPLILLAEDNEANVKTLTSYLQAQGLEVVSACNGFEAVQMAKQHRPNLIVMDIQMPGMDGLEVTRQIRKDPHLHDVPIIALTALAMPGDRERCLAAGATDYLTKPVRLKHLLDLLKHHTPGISLPERS